MEGTFGPGIKHSFRISFNAMVCCMMVSHAALAELTRMLRVRRSGETRLALHAPKPTMIQRVNIVNIIMVQDSSVSTWRRLGGLV